VMPKVDLKPLEEIFRAKVLKMLKKEDIDVIDVADYQPPRVPSKTWRKCIKKIWEVDPLLCCEIV